ncbi:condensation protein [Solihabitans fulvus]|uniref:Condensation protein n=1 Tax=Solihabitans fulvus TaxID=1892852 RepID=A0A5B2XDI0_9PSEU|nr:condensation domain-containing protein [Solihabitans fulvus]KAA2261403.1 condensation protein [Solihabitans fulvus]
MTTVDARVDTFTVPATPMQEALWWVHQRARNQSVYNLTLRLACDRAPDTDALAAAWQTVIDRHEAMRTSVVQQDGTITLVVLPKVTATMQRVEVDDPGTAPVDTLLRLLAEEIHEQTIDLSRAPLARLTTVRVGTEHELVLTVHHVVLDGWALQLLLTDLSTAYQAIVRGDRPEFEAEAVPFSVYARESVAARDAGEWQPSLDHWRSTLDGAVSTTVAADHDRFAGTGAAGVTLRYAFSREANEGVAALGKVTFGTPFAVMLAAMQVVLARGGAGEEVSVGAVIANRMTPRDQALVGYTANLCIARATIGDEDTLADVVGRSRDAMWTMLAHQNVPYSAVFGSLTESTQAMLNDYAPLLLNYLGPIGIGAMLGDITLTQHLTPNRAARSDIAIAFWEIDGGGYLAEIEYNTGRYERQTVQRLLHDLDSVLAADPQATVSGLEVRSRAVAGFVDHRPAEAPPAARLPNSPLWQQVGHIWREVLGDDPHDQDEDFFAMGGRSLKVLQLAAAIESETGHSLDLIRWLAEPTPRRLVDQLTEDRPTTVSTLVVLREGDGPHLHLVHGAGGAAHDYRALLVALPSGWRVTLSQEREPLPGVPEMAASYRADLDAAGLRPDLLCGWSMGGQICFELAAGYPEPPRLAVLDAAPPVGYENDADREAERLDSFVATVCGSLDVDLAGSLPVTSGDNPELAMRALAACLGAAGETVPAATLIERWGTYRRHTLAVSAYVTDRVLAAPVLLVGAQLLDVQLDQWAQRFATPPHRIRIDTTHYGLLGPEFADQLAAEIQSLMER